MRKFVYLFCCITLFNFLNVFQQIVYFNSVFKYLVPVSFFFVSFSLFLKNNPNWLLTKIDKIFYYLFASFTIYLLVGSIRFEVFYIQEFFVGELFLLPYLLPLFMFNINLDFKSLKLYFSIIKKLLLPGIIVLAYIIGNLNIENWYFHIHLYELLLFGFPIMFLLISSIYNYSIKIMLYIVFIMMLFFAAYYGRRSLVGDLIFLFGFSQIILLSSKSISRIYLVLRFIIFSFLIFLIFVMYSSEINKLNVFERGISVESWEESRGKVVEDFLEDFNSISDWVFGRGLNGTVKRSIGSAKEIGFGRGIENGYLQIVLKGGNIYFIFILYFFLRASYLGWFRTRNDFTKAFSALLLIHLLGMIGFNIPIFNHRYILLWLSIPICFSVNYRNLTNLEVKNLILPK